MSSCVLILAGQCGNQLGFSIISELLNSLKDDPIAREVFFRESEDGKKLFARAVFIDTEPKVIQDSFVRCRWFGWEMSEGSVQFSHGGAGNNYAQGVRSLQGALRDLSAQSVRREVERCDRSPLLLCVHSLAGGTGAGLGAAMSALLSREWPELLRLAAPVFPLREGEVCTQSFNALLALSAIAECADGVVSIDNNDARDKCARDRSLARPSLTDINNSICQSLVPCLLPRTSHRSEQSLSEDISFLCASPLRKFLSCACLPLTSANSAKFTSESWRAIFAEMAREQRDLRVKTFATLLTLHGSRAREVSRVLLPQNRNNSIGFNEHHIVVNKSQNSFNNNSRTNNVGSIDVRSGEEVYEVMHEEVFEETLRVRECGVRACGLERAVSAVRNDSRACGLLAHTVACARDLFAQKAYLHQYTREGLEIEEFTHAFNNIAQIVNNYS